MPFMHEHPMAELTMCTGVLEGKMKVEEIPKFIE